MIFCVDRTVTTCAHFRALPYSFPLPPAKGESDEPVLLCNEDVPFDYQSSPAGRKQPLPKAKLLQVTVCIGMWLMHRVSYMHVYTTLGEVALFADMINAAPDEGA